MCSPGTSTYVINDIFLHLEKVYLVALPLILLGFKSLNLFSIVDCGQMMNSQGNTLSNQIIGISQNQRDNEGAIRSLLNSSINESGNCQSPLTTSQNMEKIDDLLVSLQEQSNSLSRSY